MRPSALAVLRLMTSSKLHDLLHREDRWASALEDAAGVDADFAQQVRNIGSVAHQTAGRGELAIRADRGNGVAKCQCAELLAARYEYGSGPITSAPARSRTSVAKTVSKSVIRAGMQDMNFQPECTRRHLQAFCRELGDIRIVRIDEQANDGRPGHQLVQQRQQLCA